jgi:pimeloyl-ACP methyl ester carboxylesterase
MLERIPFSAIAAVIVATAVGSGATAKPRTPPVALSAVDSETTPVAAAIRIGSLQLMRCPDVPAYCGTLDRPLDPAGQVSGTIKIAVQLFRHRDQTQPPLETIVAVEGGPGYPSIESRTSYIPLFAPFLDRHDLLLVDNRGTGASQAINCLPLQTSAFLTIADITTCGVDLGNTSDLYGSGSAADDLAAVLDALGIDQIDLYGDSYGTFFSQTFAGRHPHRLRAVVLDSAYPVEKEPPWYPEAAPAMRNAFESACQQSLACRDLPGDTLARITDLLNSLRAHPFRGQAYDGDGHLQNVQADPTSLVLLTFGNATGPIVYRELDAAARAYLGEDNAAPLLRLLAENSIVTQSGAPPFDPTSYSGGLFVAVTCEDYPFAYDLTLPPAARFVQRNASFAEEQQTAPGVYAPFTISEFNSIPLDYSVLDTCLTWPVPSPLHPPGQPVPPGATFTSAPVLVLSGTLDSLTPAEQGKKVAALFPNATLVLVANSFHVTALGDEDDCASKIVRYFVENLNPGDTSCAAQIAEVRAIPKFAEYASEVPAATPSSGNQGTAADLRVAAATALTAGDAIARWWMNLSGSGVGLYGGTFQYTYADNAYQFQVENFEWVRDVAVTGTMSWGYSKPGTVTAQLSISGSGTEAGTLRVTWNDRQRHAIATITGAIGGRTIAATMYAP